ncbi:MAG: DNA-binding protein [Pseudomonas sp.]|uniref:DNA-binding protein n=1 Tax=Pseudomonadaceae TaxID=135621 RepID=UPI00117AE9C7|nr:DNA-binding protein [Pseudomonas putida]MPS56869.1 DNA-binding protein [Pseudomonas sp.]TRO36406.1 DNA-binding protein [Pseudomonas putida]
MTTEELILSRTGGSPLLSLTQVAEILHRSPEGLRITLSGDNELARNLRPCKVKIGRRVYFKIQDIVRLIDEASA